MKVVIVPDSFKGSLSSAEAAACIEAGFREVYPQATYIKRLISDGGEGFAEAMAQGGINVEEVRVRTVDPLGRPMMGRYIFLDRKTVVLDLATASGLVLLRSEERDPLQTSTLGTGIMLADALRKGAKELVLGLGGSATNDAGLGILQGLGYRLHDKWGRQLPPVGSSLAKVATIDDSQVPTSVKTFEITIASDVNNPLLGPDGATFTFGPQKGADRAKLAQLEEGMGNWASITKAFTGRDESFSPGAGAAGGVGFTLFSFFNGTKASGLDYLLNYIGFDRLVLNADLVVTGEGKFDAQSRWGKVPVGIARRVKKRANVQVVAINGFVEGDCIWAKDEGIDLLVSTLDSAPQGMIEKSDAVKNLTKASQNTAERIRSGKHL